MTNDFITIFKTFTDAQKGDFRQHIYYFHATKKVGLQLFEQVAKTLATGKSFDLPTHLSKEERKNAMNDFYDLKNWAIEFLTVQHIRNNSFDAQFLTLEALRKQNGLTNILEKKTEQLNDALSKQTEPDIWSSILKLRLADADYFTTEIDPLKNYQPQMQFLLDELDNFYICNKLKYLAELRSRTTILQESYNQRLLNEIENLVEKDAALNPLLKKLYLPLLALTKDQSVVAYGQLKALFMQNDLPNRRERLIVLMYLLNFAAVGQKKEPEIYYQEYFDLANIGLQESLFTSSGYFPAATFTNIANTAIYLKKYPWAKSFTNKWMKKLNPKEEPITSNYALARLHFENREFESALNLLNKHKITNYKNSHLSIHFRLLTARVNYDLPTPMPEVSQNSYCSTCEMYIIRNVQRETIRKSLLNFFKILRFLITRKFSENGKSKLQLLKALNSKDEMPPYEEWLREKINALK
jgi:hypothetical protein